LPLSFKTETVGGTSALPPFYLTVRLPYIPRFILIMLAFNNPNFYDKHVGHFASYSAADIREQRPHWSRYLNATRRQALK
jgi:hypothetical protein